MDSEELLPPGWTDNPSRIKHRARLASFAAFLSAVLFAYPNVSFVINPLNSVAGALFLIAAVFAILGGDKRWRRTPYLIGVSFVSGLLASVLIGVMAFRHLMTMPGAISTECIVALFAVSLWTGSASDEVLLSAQHLRRQFDRGHSVVKSFFGRATRKKKVAQIGLNDLVKNSRTTRARSWW